MRNDAQYIMIFDGVLARLIKHEAAAADVRELDGAGWGEDIDRWGRETEEESKIRRKVERMVRINGESGRDINAVLWFGEWSLVGCKECMEEEWVEDDAEGGTVGLEGCERQKAGFVRWCADFTLNDRFAECGRV